MLILLLFLVASIPPFGNCFSIIDKDLEVGIKEEDNIWKDTDGVQEDRMGVLLEGIGEQSGLDHDETISHSFPV